MLSRLPFQKTCLEPIQSGHMFFLPKSPDWVPAKALLHSEPWRGFSLSWRHKFVEGMVKRNGKGLTQDQPEPRG